MRALFDAKIFGQCVEMRRGVRGGMVSINQLSFEIKFPRINTNSMRVAHT